ncbi:hypothetical protein AZH11_19925 [Pseudomonas simiae]|nr:hypothetical protein AZH11_19925 [Pseudomonas simiae]
MSTPVSAKVAAILAAGPTLRPPEVLGALNPATGLISAEASKLPPTLRCELGSESQSDDWIEIRMQNLSLPLPNWVTRYGPAQFTITSTDATLDVIVPFTQSEINAGGIQDGRYQFEYRIFVNDFDENDVERPQEEFNFSMPGNFTVDRFAPWSSQINSVQPPVSTYTGTGDPAQPLTQAIINNDVGVPFNLANNTYPFPAGQFALGDTYTHYWSPNTVPLPAFEVGTTLALPTGNTFTVPARFITGGGVWYYFYTCTDAAGNVSRPSIVNRFNVSLLPTPTQLDIFIPLAPAPVGGSVDDLLDITDYLARIEFQGTYTDPQFNLDKIQWKVGSQPWTPLSATFTTLPVVFSGTVLNDLLKTEYGKQRGPVPIPMQFRVDQNGVTTDSPPKIVNVDLSVPGAENPGEPGSRNPNLNPVHIFGQGSRVPDVLTAGHANKDITAQIVLWTAQDIPGPNMWIHMVGSDGIAVLPPFEITNELPGATVSFPIPWDSGFIKFNGVQFIHYFIASSATPAPTDNINRAPDTEITVTDAVMVSLQPPEFVNAKGPVGKRAWICDSMGPRPQVIPANYDGRIFVPGNDRFVLSQMLQLVVRITSPTADAFITLEQRITPQVKASGFTFIVPFSFLRPLRFGLVQVTSIAPLEGNVSGRGNNTINGRTTLSNTYCDFVLVTNP